MWRFTSQRQRWKTRYGENEMQLRNWKGAQGNINSGHGLPNDAPYSWLWVKPKSNKEEKLRDKHIKWNGENGRKMEWENLWLWVRNVTPLGGWCAPRWVCWPPLESFSITQDKTSSLRGHLTKSLHNLCRVSLVHSNSTCKIQWVGLLFIGEGGLENK